MEKIEIVFGAYSKEFNLDTPIIEILDWAEKETGMDRMDAINSARFYRNSEEVVF